MAIFILGAIPEHDNLGDGDSIDDVNDNVGVGVVDDPNPTLFNEHEPFSFNVS